MALKKLADFDLSMLSALLLCEEEEMSVQVDDIRYFVYTQSSRYKTFGKSNKCCVCSTEGTIMRLEVEDLSKKPGTNYHNKYERPHFNLYGYNEYGDLVMLTKDHIVPRSLGGKNSSSNYRTMCARCNHKKGNRQITDEVLWQEIIDGKMKNVLKVKDDGSMLGLARRKEATCV